MSVIRDPKKRMKTAILLPVAVSLFLAQAPTALGQEGWSFPIHEYRLKNGLRVILSEDASFPLVTVVVAYGAGTVREREGQEGLAYLMENMMFQGSDNIAPLQHVSYIQKVGGELNATTTFDKALFYQTVPSNQLALALWLESDRMKSTVITQAAVDRQRNTLLEEHLGRLERDPYLESFSIFDMLLYPDFLYGHPLIGIGEEMKRLRAADVSAFRRAYYVPNNAVLCIVGNIQIPRTKELVAQYFESIPQGPQVPAIPLPRFEQQGEVTIFLPDIPVPTPGFHLGYRFYPLQTGDAYSLRVLEYILMKGKTSRLRSRLFERDRTAHHLSGGLEERGGARALKIFCLSTNAVLADRAQRAIMSEIERLRKNPVSEDDLTKAKRLFKMDYMRRLATGRERALVLVETAVSGRPLESLPDELDRHLRVSPTTLTTLVIRYFIPRNKVVLRLGPR